MYRYAVLKVAQSGEPAKLVSQNVEGYWLARLIAWYVFHYQGAPLTVWVAAEPLSANVPPLLVYSRAPT